MSLYKFPSESEIFGRMMSCELSDEPYAYELVQEFARVNQHKTLNAAGVMMAWILAVTAVCQRNGLPEVMVRIMFSTLLSFMEAMLMPPKFFAELEKEYDKIMSSLTGDSNTGI